MRAIPTAVCLTTSLLNENPRDCSSIGPRRGIGGASERNRAADEDRGIGYEQPQMSCSSKIQALHPQTLEQNRC